MERVKMVTEADLGLSLSLMTSSTSDNRFPLQLSLMPPCSSSQIKQWSDLLADGGPQLRGIDVNRAPAAEIENDEDVAVSSPNSTVSSVSGKRGGGDREDGERACSRSGASDEEDGDNSRKKLRLSKDQSAILEESFKEHNTLNPKQKLALAKQLNLRPRQVEVWFQNRRARTKLKQTEVDCEFLKRCCENLTEENRRLQKEVAELRALKLTPQFYMHMTPPTTLTMCPSCERVAAPNTSTGAAGASTAPTSSEQHPQTHHYNQVPQHHSSRPFMVPRTSAAVPRPSAALPHPAGAPWTPIPLRLSAREA